MNWQGVKELVGHNHCESIRFLVSCGTNKELTLGHAAQLVAPGNGGSELLGLGFQRLLLKLTHVHAGFNKVDRVDSDIRERLECLHCQQGLDQWTYSNNILHERPATWTELDEPALRRAAGCHPSSHEPDSNKLEKSAIRPSRH